MSTYLEKGSLTIAVVLNEPLSLEAGEELVASAYSIIISELTISD